MPHYTEPTVVWHHTWPKPKTPWFEITTENPVCFVIWSYGTWGKKIVKAYVHHFQHAL